MGGQRHGAPDPHSPWQCAAYECFHRIAPDIADEDVKVSRECPFGSPGNQFSAFFLNHVKNGIKEPRIHTRSKSVRRV